MNPSTVYAQKNALNGTPKSLGFCAFNLRVLPVGYMAWGSWGQRPAVVALVVAAGEAAATAAVAVAVAAVAAAHPSPGEPNKCFYPGSPFKPLGTEILQEAVGVVQE